MLYHIFFNSNVVKLLFQYLNGLLPLVSTQCSERNADLQHFNESKFKKKNSFHFAYKSSHNQTSARMCQFMLKETKQS